MENGAAGLKDKIKKLPHFAFSSRARQFSFAENVKRPLTQRSTATDCRKTPDRPPAPANSALRPTPPHVCGQALRYACAWLRASWPSAISGASRPSASLGGGLRPAVAPSGLSSSTGCPVSHSSLPVALLASHPPCGSLWAAPKAPLGPRFPSGQFASLTRREKALYCPFLKEGVRNVARSIVG